MANEKSKFNVKDIVKELITDNGSGYRPVRDDYKSNEERNAILERIKPMSPSYKSGIKTVLAKL
ncbi:hypothetical protein [Thalassotalea sp. SU-HH00458]|uniref:hypothetical protein n=1 Tax=Thalassotalea sp. SU-HH00458 TaxID=3127657 RepID=UPI00310C3699